MELFDRTFSEAIIRKGREKRCLSRRSGKHLAAFHVLQQISASTLKKIIEGESPFLQKAVQIESLAGGNIREDGWIL